MQLKIIYKPCIHGNWFYHPKRSSGVACCPLAFYSSVNNGLYINILFEQSIILGWNLL